MPKIIELTVEIDIQKVSCPGVWLCQDGRVSLTVFALGTSYQTCLLPPMFPLMFKDFFYFRKRFQETCALNNICCLLKDETIYCELVQWSSDCSAGECTILAQYLGALNDVLFPPNMCSNDGVDLLMRRSKEFPGILSPKIEITTKVRIDEIWNQPSSANALKVSSCSCSPQDPDTARQKAVCHSAQYHRNKCSSTGNKRPPSGSRSRSRSRSGGSRSCCSLPKEPEVTCCCPSPVSKSRASLSPYHKSCRRARRRQYNVYNVDTALSNVWKGGTSTQDDEFTADDEGARSGSDIDKDNAALPSEERLQKIILESRYIDQHKFDDTTIKTKSKKITKTTVSPCVCEICKRYHQLFHTNNITNYAKSWCK